MPEKSQMQIKLTYSHPEQLFAGGGAGWESLLAMEELPWQRQIAASLSEHQGRTPSECDLGAYMRSSEEDRQ